MAKMSPEERLERLRVAREEPHPVSIRRRIEDADEVTGYVVGVGREWALVAELDDGLALDGFAAVRRDDVRKVERRARGERF